MIKQILATSAMALALVACGTETSVDTQEARPTYQDQPAPGPDIDISIPFEKFVLPNGLRVVVHEDRKAPVVAVSVWYHVGSKDEPQGKTGFAHLFEHLMFNGSENYDDEYFKPLEKVGVTNINGTTWFDRTNYYETVPTPALETALFLESDRMGHLLGAVTQDKLDEQRGVVQNEKRQGDNRPYGQVEYRQLEALFPPGHPYRHSTIGSMEDLDAASLEDVKSWFKEYYGAANTVIVLSGDINATEARPLMEKYFGDIAAGPALNHRKAWVPTLDVDVYDEMLDQRAPATRIYKNWLTPSRTTRDGHVLRIAAEVLGGGKNSRLYQALVYNNQLASNVTVYNQRFELASMFEVMIDLKPGADEDKAIALMEAEIEKFLETGPTVEEVVRAKTSIVSSRIRGLERATSKATVLAQGELYAGDAGFYAKELAFINEASTGDIVRAAQKWLGKGSYNLTVRPYPKYQKAESVLDRSSLPDVGDLPSLQFPEIVEDTLSNGMKVVLATRSTIPVVNARLVFDAGYAADPAGAPGTSGMTLSMLDEGTSNKSALEISAELEALGATLGTGSNLDTSTVSFSSLKSNLKPALEIMGDVVRNPAFAQEELDRLRQRQLAGIQRELAQPLQIALRALPGLLYGDGHSYSAPYTGSGTKASLEAMTRDNLISFKDTWLRPDNGTLFIVGDVTMAEVKPILEDVLGDWQAPTTPKPTKNIAEVALPEKPRVVVVDTPGAPQTFILSGHLLPGIGSADTLAISAANEALGGAFTARINMNLREDKGWSYGAQTIALGAKGQRIWLIYAPVQTDRTGDSVAELVREISEYLSTNPATMEELQKIRASNINSLPGQFETATAVLGSIVNNATYGRPYDYATGTKDRYDSLDLPTIHAAAQTYIKPQSILWLMVGDSAKIKAQLEPLGLGEIEVITPADLP